MYAYFRYDDGILSHSWYFTEAAEETENGVVIDGHPIQDTTLERVETDAVYRNAGEPPERESDGLLARLRRLL